MFNRVRRFSPAGNAKQPEYGYVCEKGRTVFKVVGEIDIPERINSFAKARDLNSMIMRALAGDTSVLTVKSAQFGDFTQIPNSLSEIQNRLLIAKDTFAKLPVEVRQMYNNNIDDFTTALFDGSFEKYLKEKENEIAQKSCEVPAQKGAQEVPTMSNGSTSSTQLNI